MNLWGKVLILCPVHGVGDDGCLGLRLSRQPLRRKRLRSELIGQPCPECVVLLTLLHRHRFPGLTLLRIGAAVAGAALAATGMAPAAVAFALIALGELIGRYLFYVTVVPLNMPGSSTRVTRTRSAHR